MDVIDGEVEEFKVPNEETVKVTNAVWGLENSSPKVIDEDPEVTWVPVAVSKLNHGDTLDFEGMPDLEDGSYEKITGVEPSVDIPSAEGPPALPWVHFEAQIHEDEIQYWVAMFTWFLYMHLSWEGSQKERDNA